ncbi:MAG TPA: citrate synthase, partial [Vicinamibacterales bacterium]|nr:citrate synthase [Vicinamibacterales bacterium]
MTRPAPWIDAAAAAARLGVSRATLYAYVSRGLIRSQLLPGSSRAHGYAREDVERLRQRTAARRDPALAAAHALEWGVPVLESAITFIDGRALYYRGHDVVTLARERSLEEVAALIWTGGFNAVFPPALPATIAAAAPERHAPFVLRAQTRLAAAAADDPGAGDLRPASVAAAGWRMLHLLADAAAGVRGTRRRRVETMDQQLARAWKTGPHGAEILRATLILCADHELNVSSFTARCVASAGSTPYAVVIAGLAALEGFRHGGSGVRVDAMIGGLRAEVSARSARDRQRALERAIGARMRAGDVVGGFGHQLYPAGDPRAKALLDLLERRAAGSAELAYLRAFQRAAAAIVREEPNLDFALAGVARVLRLPAGAPLMLFAIGRTIGWIGQAIEQYATGQLIRPRARY